MEHLILNAISDTAALARVSEENIYSAVILYRYYRFDKILRRSIDTPTLTRFSKEDSIDTLTLTRLSAEDSIDTPTLTSFSAEDSIDTPTLTIDSQQKTVSILQH